VVANAQHVKKVPGRKTDVKDAEWIADLLCHGLLRSSFVPPKSIRELRDLTHYRRKLVESQATERNRLLKLVETYKLNLILINHLLQRRQGQVSLDGSRLFWETLVPIVMVGKESVPARRIDSGMKPRSDRPLTMTPS
jgi:hypothetical protein